jgi:hypothetical protein
VPCLKPGVDCIDRIEGHSCAGRPKGERQKAAGSPLSDAAGRHLRNLSELVVVVVSRAHAGESALRRGRGKEDIIRPE